MKNSSFTPTDVKNMSLAELDDLASSIRQQLVETTATNGGHLSSNLGVVEATIALVYSFDPLKDDILFDVGHQAYTYKILTERNIKTIRTKGGLSPFQDCLESKYDKYEAGHSSTAISTAYGMACAKEMDKDNSYTIAFVGDASLVNGLSFEGLNAIGEGKSDHLIIVINDNGMSIGKTRGALSLERTIDADFFEALGLTYVGPIDGHDVKAMIDVYEKVKELRGSVVVHLKTNKGHGYSPAQEDEDGYWHGVSPFDPISLKPKNMHVGQISFSHAKSDLLYQVIKKDLRAVLINPAMVKGAGEEKIFEDFKDRSFDVGIAEEHAFTFAAGLALKGYHPIITIYSTFFQRAFDECFHDLAHQDLKALILLERSGLVGADGETHQGIYDLSLLLAIPNAKIMEPYDYPSLVMSLEKGKEFDGLNFIRIPRQLLRTGEKRTISEYEYRKKSNKLLLAFGTYGQQLVSKVDCSTMMTYLRNNYDEKFYQCLIEHDEIVIYDPTSTDIGYSSYLSYQLSRRGFKGKLIVLALPSAYISHATIDEQLQSLNLDVDSVFNEYFSF